MPQSPLTLAEFSTILRPHGLCARFALHDTLYVVTLQPLGGAVVACGIDETLEGAARKALAKIPSVPIEIVVGEEVQS